MAHFTYPEGVSTTLGDGDFNTSPFAEGSLLLFFLLRAKKNDISPADGIKEWILERKKRKTSAMAQQDTLLLKVEELYVNLKWNGVVYPYQQDLTSLDLTTFGYRCIPDIQIDKVSRSRSGGHESNSEWATTSVSALAKNLFGLTSDYGTPAKDHANQIVNSLKDTGNLGDYSVYAKSDIGFGLSSGTFFKKCNYILLRATLKVLSLSYMAMLGKNSLESFLYEDDNSSITTYPLKSPAYEFGKNDISRDTWTSSGDSYVYFLASFDPKADGSLNKSDPSYIKFRDFLFRKVINSATGGEDYYAKDPVANPTKIRSNSAIKSNKAYYEMMKTFNDQLTEYDTELSMQFYSTGHTSSSSVKLNGNYGDSINSFITKGLYAPADPLVASIPSKNYMLSSGYGGILGSGGLVLNNEFTSDSLTGYVTPTTPFDDGESSNVAVMFWFKFPEIGKHVACVFVTSIYGVDPTLGIRKSQVLCNIPLEFAKGKYLLPIEFSELLRHSSYFKVTYSSSWYTNTDGAPAVGSTKWLTGLVVSIIIGTIQGGVPGAIFAAVMYIVIPYIMESIYTSNLSDKTKDILVIIVVVALIILNPSSSLDTATAINALSTSYEFYNSDQQYHIAKEQAAEIKRQNEVQEAWNNSYQAEAKKYENSIEETKKNDMSMLAFVGNGSAAVYTGEDAGSYFNRTLTLSLAPYLKSVIAYS